MRWRIRAVARPTAAAVAASGQGPRRRPAATRRSQRCSARRWRRANVAPTRAIARMQGVVAGAPRASVGLSIATNASMIPHRRARRRTDRGASGGPGDLDNASSFGPVSTRSRLRCRYRSTWDAGRPFRHFPKALRIGDVSRWRRIRRRRAGRRRARAVPGGDARARARARRTCPDRRRGARCGRGFRCARRAWRRRGHRDC